MKRRFPYPFWLCLGWILLISASFSPLKAQDTIFLYGDTVRVGVLEWDMQKDWRSRRKLIAENRDLYGDHVRILLTYHKNRMVSEINFGYIDKAEGFVKHGPARYYYDSGHLKSTRTFREGKMVGKVEDFYKDGKSERIAFAQNDSLEGSYMSFYPDGSLHEKGNYHLDVLQGRYRAWYNTGEIKWVEHWENGKKTGIDSTFYETEKLESVIPFEDGLENGIAYGFHRNGQAWTQWVYEKGRLVDVLFVHNSSGHPLEVGTFKNGNGWLNIYKENGLVKARQLYKDGYLHRIKTSKEKE